MYLDDAKVPARPKLSPRWGVEVACRAGLQTDALPSELLAGRCTVSEDMMMTSTQQSSMQPYVSAVDWEMSTPTCNLVEH